MFRTLLAVIRTVADWLQQCGDRLSDADKTQKLDRIQANVAEMVDRLDDVLGIGRAEAGKLQFDPEPLNVFDDPIMTYLNNTVLLRNRSSTTPVIGRTGPV
jgi:signal transduction histidine kinase